MNLLEAIQSGKKFTHVDIDESIQHFKQDTGPYKHLFTCDYFVVCGEGTVSLHLFSDEILGDYKLIE